MLYRRFGSTGAEVSALGFGCMRFLSRKGVPTWRANVDVEKAVALLHEARQSGMNYFDTAYNYHAGTSERIVGRFLSEIPRDSVLVATKSPVWKMRKPSDFKRYLTIQLRRLGTERVDFYLLHGLDRASFDRCRELGALEFLEAEIRRGRIGHAGFSFHDEPSAFAPIVDSFDWGFCLMQYNLVDEHSQAGVSGLRYAASKGMGVAVMEPLRGGDLVNGLPEVVRRGWAEQPGYTPAQHCLRWIWDQPGVSVVLSGMGTRDQLAENLQAASATPPGSLSREERDLYARMQSVYENLRKTGCTRCCYCMPCPSGVFIPRIMELLDESEMFPESSTPALSYNMWLGAERRADRCTGCGSCESRCPQKLPVTKLLAGAHAVFTGGGPRG